MTTWIAMLRGINVGGKNLLPMKELVAALEDLGCSNIKTYIQSGNVVFRKSGAKATQLAARIEKAVLDARGFAPRVLVLTTTELENAASANPFPDAVSDPKSLHLLFLSKKPDAPDLDSLTDIKAASESFSLIDNVFYLHAPDGIGRSRLAARAEKLLGVDATGRNWRTVSKLLDLANGI